MMFQPGESERTYRRGYALCVGIGMYPNLINRNLRYARNDATVIAERLADPHRGNFAVTVLTEPAKTTKAALEQAVEQLLSTPDRRPDDLALLYFSCHGDLNRIDHTFCLLPSDASLQDDGMFDPTTLVSIHDFARWFENATTQNIVVLLDVCHSGGAGAALQHFTLKLERGPNFFFIGAARLDQVTMQSSLLQHGLFTHCLLRAFEQPPTADGWLTISQIQSFVSDELPWFAKDHPTHIQSWSVFVDPNLPLLRNPGYPELCPLPPLWNVPWPRNTFFTGQEELLSRLTSMLHREQKTALMQPHALSGLGGIGKTQLALEYAYRHRQNYHAVLWGRADTYEALISTFVSIAHLLDLPQKDEQDQMVIVEAVKTWLKDRSQWLFILDNADDLALVQEFLPSTFRGHLLLTTRAQAMGKIVRSKLEVEVMRPEIGALLLLRRARILTVEASLGEASDEKVTRAKELAEELGGLPLALDQAGAYIEETKCSLPQYLSLYQKQRAKLLKRRGNFASDHPDSVTTTFSLSFEKIKRANWTAARLLEFCAFLDPDIIPEEIVANWAYRFYEFRPSFESFYQHYAKDQFELDKMIEELLKYSLVRRHPDEQTLSIHRLVQAVLMDRMSRKRKRRWEGKVVVTVTEVFPRPTTVSWPNCQRYLSHAQICLTLVDQWKLALIFTPSWEFSASAELLEKAGDYLRQRARYKEAELMYEQLLRIEEKRKKIWGKSSDSFDRDRVIDKLARVYTYQGKYSRAGDLLLVDGLAHRYRQSVVKRIPIPNSRDLPDDWPQIFLHNEVARLFHNYPDLRDAVIYNNVAKIFYDSGNPTNAGRVFQMEALEFWKKVTPTASGNNGFHTLLYKRRITADGYVYIKAAFLNNEAVLLIPFDPNQAESSLKLALTIQESQLGSEHPEIAGYFNNLASLYLLQGEYTQAELLFQRALTIRKQRLGKEHPEVAISLNNLASLYSDQGEYGWAEPLFQQALQIQEQYLRPDHIDRVRVLKSYAILLQKVGRMDEATKLEQQAEAILLAVQEQENIGQKSLSIGTHQKPVWTHPGLYFAWCPPEIY